MAEAPLQRTRPARPIFALISLGGHNFAVLFPIWDMLAGSARFDGRFDATGIRDLLPEHGGRDCGQGFWAQQRLGLQRLAATLLRRRFAAQPG
ncbi:MAG: hypothetical protein IPI03_17895 [Rubrivivax sp.]|nr:hypothetical protein [Rubrivivax sp.]MBK8526860.1 hypothetical protein [Rubrivivax sp.]